MGHIGILGGSFNPIHLGHLFMGSAVSEALGLDRLLFIPCVISPLKLGMSNLASGVDRLEMIRLSVAKHPVFEASALDLKRGGISYAIDTVKALREQYHQDKISFIIGMDALRDLHRWHQIEELLTLCEFVTVERPGVDRPVVAETLGFAKEIQRQLMGNIIQGRLCDISSSDIRTRIAQGQSIRYLVCSDVEAYIQTRGLYFGQVKQET